VFEREAAGGEFQEVGIGADILRIKENYTREIYELELNNSLLVRVPSNFRDDTLSRLVSTLKSL